MTAALPATGLPAADAAFAREHARAWASGADNQRAGAYADWYAATFIPAAASLEDLPAHPHVWGRFLDQYRPGPS